MRRFIRILQEQRGISLVEVMVVVAVMAMVMVSVYGYYISQMKSSKAQEEVAEVQQNLRVAMEMMSRDIKMAGYLCAVTGSTTPLNNTSPHATNTSTITINTASTSATSAMVNSVSGSAVTVKTGGGALFSNGNTVRILRPDDKSLIGTFTVNSISGDILTLSGSAATQKGDVLVKVTANSNHPNTLKYRLNNGNLERITNEGVTGVVDTQVVANNITGLAFTYFDDDGNATTDMAKISGVRVTLTGQTARIVSRMNESSASTARQRVVSFTVGIRNRAVGAIE